MSNLSLDEIRRNAIDFSNQWKNAFYEKGQSQTFWNEFFEIFGISRRRVASFEEPVKKIGNKQGYIDLFWKGKLLIEHKSLGKDLGKAKTQAFDYFPNIPDSELPKFILVCDFQNFELLDLDEDKNYRFKLSELSENIGLFNFMTDRKKAIFEDKSPLNIQAGILMGELHDQFVESGYIGRDLELFLVRHLFLLFADSSDIWEKNLFARFIESIDDVKFIGSQISYIFQVLNTPIEKRSKFIDEIAKQFPYVNGSVFSDVLPIATFNQDMKNKFLNALKFDWSEINPVIFGSIFQASMDKNKRSELGSHFTSEENILKVIKPLFFDNLYSEFEEAKGNQKALSKLQAKISNLKFLDPACGSGNFLIIAFRELKLLEFEIIKETKSVIQMVSIEQFFGFEIDELPARITEIAMLLIDHQMNRLFEHYFMKTEFNIPIKKVANIFHVNSLQIDWDETLKSEIDFIFGNPPFLGSKVQNQTQKNDMKTVFKSVKNSGNLDLVTAWFLKSAEYIHNHEKTETALVSTNSIIQGEQVGVLWFELLENYEMNINFAHQTFKWNNEAKNNAQVHCVIVGFGKNERTKKQLFEYETVKSKPIEKVVKNINPYLFEGESAIILNLSSHIQANRLEMVIGNKPIDGGNYIFTESEKDDFLKLEPKAEKFFKTFLGAREFLNSEKRFILWLGEAQPNELRKMPKVLERVDEVRKLRLKSSSKPTKKLAETPTRFHVENIPKSNYLFLPRVSSENRKYIPIGFLSPENIASDSGIILPNATLYDFGILTSSMHMSFMRYVAGRLKSDYRYSIGIVYNNFPFPINISESQKKRISELAQKILEIRDKFENNSLADLYNSNTMPPELLKAHQNLDKAVDKLYNSNKIFKSDKERVQKIFALHREITTLFTEKEKTKKLPQKREIEKKIKKRVPKEQKEDSSLFDDE